jgi:hypothetical protein
LPPSHAKPRAMSLLNNLFGGNQPDAAAVPAADSDFASFPDGAADPVPEPLPVTPTDGAAAFAAPAATPTGVAWTKWYNVHERHSLSEFRLEGFFLAVIAVFLVAHAIGARANRARARGWIRAFAPALRAEFATVGCDGVSTVGATAPPPPTQADTDALLRENALYDFISYASGRLNVAFADINIRLAKRFNPAMVAGEHVLGYLFDSFETPRDTAEVVLYPFDGREALSLPTIPGAAELRARDPKSTYDNFVFAIVNKIGMQRVRDTRFDVSITFTKDHARLPPWATVMSESAEITEALLTPELAGLIARAGDVLDYLIITDQPADKPTTPDEAASRKRVYLRHSIPADGDYSALVPLFEYFLRLPDILVKKAHFRPEVQRKIKAVRDELLVIMRREEESEKAEERAAEREKTKKAKRDAELKALDAKAQKRYLEREREKGLRKGTKKMK